jgi:hypothetical protein
MVRLRLGLGLGCDIIIHDNQVGPQTHSFIMHKREHVQFEKTCHQNLRICLGTTAVHLKTGLVLASSINHT